MSETASKRKVLFKEPVVDLVKLSSTETAPSDSAEWANVPNSDIVQDSVAITPTKGTTSQLKDDTGNVAASHTAKTTQALTVKTFFPISSITDADGVIDDEYAVRIYEKSTRKGYIIERAEVSCADSYNATDGQFVEYTFNALKPTSGNMLKPYTAPAST